MSLDPLQTLFPSNKDLGKRKILLNKLNERRTQKLRFVNVKCDVKPVQLVEHS